MDKYDWKVKFKFENLLVENPIKNEIIEFNSPHFPSTKKGENFTDGILSISFDNSKHSVEEVVKEGLEFVLALNNRVNLPCNVEIVVAPLSMFCLSCSIEAHTTHKISNPEIIPELWNNYKHLLDNDSNDSVKLSSSINWYMRSIRADEPVDKFIFSWITFNMLYNWLTDAAGDEHNSGIKSLTGKGIPRINVQREIVSKQIQIFTWLAGNQLIDRNEIDRSKHLRESLLTNNPTKILNGAIEAIGFIRHNIFHGSLVDKSAEAGRCFEPINHLNSEIIKYKLATI